MTSAKGIIADSFRRQPDMITGESFPAVGTSLRFNIFIC